MLNNISVKEAVDIAIVIRDKLELNCDLPLRQRWLEKDALAVLINYAEKKAGEEEK